MENDSLVWTWAHTFDETISDQSFWNASQVRVNWERRTRRGFSWKSNVSSTGDNFNPGIGFVPRSDYIHIGQELNYGWMPREYSLLHWHSLKLDVSV